MVFGTRDRLRSKQIDAYIRSRAQRNLPNRPLRDRPWRYRHRPDDDWYTEDYSDFRREQWHQVTPKASPSQKLKEQWESGSPYKTPRRLKENWAYKPKPKPDEGRRPTPLPPFELPDLDEPPFPTPEPPAWEPPFEPDEGPEDTGDEDMGDDPRERRLPDPIIPTEGRRKECADDPIEAMLLNIPLCTKVNETLQIRTGKLPKTRKNGKTNHKSRNRYNSRKKGKLRQTHYPRYFLSRL